MASAHKEISVSLARMGRRLLGVRQTPVRLYVDQADRIDAAYGPNKRARFIREAVDAELKSRGYSQPPEDRPEGSLEPD